LLRFLLIFFSEFLHKNYYIPSQTTTVIVPRTEKDRKNPKQQQQQSVTVVQSFPSFFSNIFFKLLFPLFIVIVLIVSVEIDECCPENNTQNEWSFSERDALKMLELIGRPTDRVLQPVEIAIPVEDDL
jgi:hypothetical protein